MLTSDSGVALMLNKVSPVDDQINGDFGNVVKAAQLVVERLREAPRRPRTQNVQNTPLSITPTMLVQGSVNPGVYGVQGIPQVTL